jgi:hypothetical protein
MQTTLTVQKVYRGITDENCLLWCHGTIGVHHNKVRKFRYPVWKYAHTSYRIVTCICTNCNMQFYGDLAVDVPLDIPVVKLSSYFAESIPVTINGKIQALSGEVIKPFRHITQSMLNDETSAFIELVQ